MYISTEVYVFPVPLDFETRKVLSKKCICVPLRPITDSKQFRGKISSFRIISVRDKSLANWIVSVEDSPWSRVIDTRLRPSLNWAGETIGLRLSSLRSIPITTATNVKLLHLTHHTHISFSSTRCTTWQQANLVHLCAINVASRRTPHLEFSLTFARHSFRILFNIYTNFYASEKSRNRSVLHTRCLSPKISLKLISS